jgi:uncharacterized protein
VGVTFTDQATPGSTQNLLLLEQRKAMIALMTLGTALQGWNGTDWAKGTQYRSMRALFPMYDNVFQFFPLKRSNLGSLSAFAGKRIGGGPKGGPSGTYNLEIFKALDIPAILRFGALEDSLRDLAPGGSMGSQSK